MKNRLCYLLCYPCTAILLSVLILFLSGCSTQKDYVLSDDDSGCVLLSEEDSDSKKDITNDSGTDMGQMANMANAKQDMEDDKHQIYVDICGAVNNPGVYSFYEGARVFEVITAAGGLTNDACLEAVNRAERVSDGQKLYIPNQTEWEQRITDDTLQAVIETDDGLVNLNDASESELCTLPGIGAARAQAIIAYREEQGGFATIEEIQNVSGIKSGTYEKIKNLIKVK